MTREEEIKQMAQTKENELCSMYQAFVLGATWADSHPNLSEEEQVGMGELGMLWQKKALINKAIDILIDFSNDGYLIDIHNHEEFEKNFRKVMEEGL